MPTLAQDAARALTEAGVRRAFVVGSNQNLKVLDALAESGIECRPARCEVGAVHTADGHARASRQPTLVVTSTGPGAGNAIGAYAAAAKDSSPLIHVTTTYFPGGPDAHGVHSILDQGGWLQAMGAPVVDLGSDSVAMLERALQERKGALTLVVPDDDRTAYPLPRPTVADVISEPVEALRAPLEDWARSARPLLWVGGGARHIPTDRLVSIAERSGAAVVTSVQGKDLFPADHPNHIGCTLQSSLTRDALSSAEACLALGSRMSELSTSGWTESFPSVLVRASYSRERPPFPKTRIHDAPVDVAVVVDYLEETLPDTPRTEFGPGAARSLREARASRNGGAEEHAILDAITQALGDDGILVCDMTKLAFWAILAVDMPRGTRFLFPGMLNMGFGLPAGIGASFAAPDSHVVVLAGDGGLISMAPELDTARRVSGRLSIVLIDDDGYGLLRPFATPTVAEQLCSFPGPSWSDLARAFDLDYVAADSPATIGAALERTTAGTRIIHVDGRDLCRENWRQA